MFACLGIKSYKQLSLFEKIRFSLGRGGPEIFQVTTKEMRYCIVQLIEKKGQVNLDLLYETVPRLAKGVVMPRSFQPPEHSRVSRHCPKRLPEQLALQSVLAMSQSSRIPLARRSLGLLDEKGIYTAFAEKMIKYVPTLKVCTYKPGDYAQTEEKLMNLYGAPLLLDTEMEFLRGCDLIFSPESADFRSVQGTPVVTALPPAREKSSSTVFTVKEVDVPAELRDELPEEYEPLDFLDALYVYCGIQDLQRLRVTRFSALSGDVGPEHIRSLAERRYSETVCTQKKYDSSIDT